MKKTSFFTLIFIVFACAAFAQNNAWRAKVAPEILSALNRGEKSDLLVAFTEQADVNAVKYIHGKSAKAHFVFSKLQETAQRTQSRAAKLVSLNNGEANTLFLVNALSVRNADAALVQHLAELPEVKAVAYDPWVFFPGPESVENESVAERDGIEWGVQRVHAPEVWALGYSGQGITVGGADTGYEWGHPALKQHYRGWDNASNIANHNYNWHDAIHEISPLSVDTLGNLIPNPCGLDLQEPCDDHFHGTHTMGTMTGDDGMGNQIGVAPGAKWVGCRNMEHGWGKPSSYIECFQWFLAPTDLGGQNPDPEKAPHVINNSWYCDFVEGCTDLTVNELIHVAVTNLKASGVVVVVSNGNFGSDGCATTSGAPAYFEESFSVGSIRINDTISGFSSRGPVIIDQSERLKPNISAPGSSVRSSTLNGGYGNASGTSMAGPHVVGVVALVLSARPDLAGEVDLIEDILEQQAFPLYDTIACGVVPGDAHPNNTYGYGRVDALASLQAALAYSPSQEPTAVRMWAEMTPNPVLDNAIFTMDNLSGITHLEILNAEGSLVFEQNWNISGRNMAQIPMNGQPKGIYFWQIKSGSESVSGKFIKI